MCQLSAFFLNFCGFDDSTTRTCEGTHLDLVVFAEGGTERSNVLFVPIGITVVEHGGDGYEDVWTGEVSRRRVSLRAEKTKR